jgi:hypothetical protein
VADAGVPQRSERRRHEDGDAGGSGWRQTRPSLNPPSVPVSCCLRGVRFPPRLGPRGCGSERRVTSFVRPSSRSSARAGTHTKAAAASLPSRGEAGNPWGVPVENRRIHAEVAIGSQWGLRSNRGPLEPRLEGRNVDPGEAPGISDAAGACAEEGRPDRHNEARVRTGRSSKSAPGSYGFTSSRRPGHCPSDRARPADSPSSASVGLRTPTFFRSSAWRVTLVPAAGSASPRRDSRAATGDPRHSRPGTPAISLRLRARLL